LHKETKKPRATGFYDDPAPAGRRDFAPDWIQRHGITWLYRLVQEPGRMWKRYFKYNSLFLFYLIKDILCGSAPQKRKFF